MIKVSENGKSEVTKLLGTIGGIIKRKRIPYGDRGVVITPTE